MFVPSRIRTVTMEEVSDISTFPTFIRENN